MISPFFLDLTEQEITELERSLGEILRGGTLILGSHTRDFEAAFAEYCGTEYAVAVNSGTSALEILLTAQNAKGKRVAVPSNTNFASVAAIIRAGGEPVFMDMTVDYFAPDLDILKHTVEKYRVNGVLWVHIGGIIVPDFIEVVEYCKANGLFLIEDCAHAHGSRLRGVKAGAFADGGAFSFFPTKVMTTIEGGMITTNEESVAQLARSMRNQGKRAGDYGGLHYDLGNSWRISELSAKMGLIMLDKLDAMVGRRSSAVRGVTQQLDRLGIEYCDTSHMEQASQYKFIIRLQNGMEYEEAKSRLREEGVNCGGGVYEIPCHLHPVFKDISYSEGDLSVTEEHCPRHICPPITSGTTDDDVVVINRSLEKLCA